MCDLEHFGRQMIAIILAKLDIAPLYQNNQHPENFGSRAAQQLADLNLGQAVVCRRQKLEDIQTLSKSRSFILFVF